MSARELITEHLDLWTGAVKKKSSSGRGSNGKVELTGVKKLRELILELAVRGQLVPQSPEDTSFRELVLQLREDHAPTKTRGRKTVSGEVSEDEKPFNIPKTWVWTRLGEIVDVLDSQRKPITKAARKSGPYPYYGASGIVDYVDGYLFDESLVLVGEDGAKWDKGEGTAFSISGKTWVNNHAHVLRPRREAVTDDYLVYFLTAADLNPFITGMTVPKLNQARLSSIPVATPNLEEQHRIVQKVDELMALCDRLEQQTSDQLEAHETLVDTLLGTLTQSENATELADNWARLASHFDTLFTTEQSIDKLKQTILQLAVMGRLVERDNDQPVDSLISALKAEKLEMFHAGAIRKPKKSPPLEAREHPFSIPKSWRWTRLNALTSILGDGLHGTPNYDTRGEFYFVNGNNLSDGKIKLSHLTKRVSQEEFNKHKKELSDRTVLVSINGTLGRVAFYSGEKIMLGKSACYFNLLQGISKEYIKHFLQSPFFMEYAKGQATGSTIKNLSLKAMNELPVPLPPTQEQHRIVQKVDELMALCDQLKERLNQASETRFQLAEAVVDNALN